MIFSNREAIESLTDHVEVRIKTYTDIFNTAGTHTWQNISASDINVHVMLFGGGSGGSYYSGGLGGHMARGTFKIAGNEKVLISIGDGGVGSDQHPTAGGTTSFGTYLSADGGTPTTSITQEGSGGSGGGGGDAYLCTITYGGGGGSDGGRYTLESDEAANGLQAGNGGTYGGGGGGSSKVDAGRNSTVKQEGAHGSGGLAGVYGGNGGNGGSNGTLGVDTKSENVEFTGSGSPGLCGNGAKISRFGNNFWISYGGGGGGGGYGGNGGNGGDDGSSSSSSYVWIATGGGGGGGGYGADGGNGGNAASGSGYTMAAGGGGGGGGYGGKGGDGSVNSSHIGYRGEGYGAGGGGPMSQGDGTHGGGGGYGKIPASIQTNDGTNGICIITYTIKELVVIQGN